AGLDVDAFAPRLSFFFNAHNDVFQEVAKFRAARRMWAHVMRDRFGARDERSLILRFHAQTGGSTLTAQQPEVNLIRVALQAFSATAGGAQSLHTNGFDEALALPTEHAATLALRTQQVLLHESGVPATADPFGGSWYVEDLTDQLEARALELIAEIDRLGGAVAAIEQGHVQDQIEESAYRSQMRLERGEDVVVGVNRYRSDEEPEVPIHRLDPALEREQVARVQALRASRDAGAVEAALAEVRAAADRDGAPLLEPMRTALAAHATVGEVCGVLRAAWGTHDR
ncbi:MAG: methylmalonyl-CoA mutase family protein, partial [Actinomycetota bacterium]